MKLFVALFSTFLVTEIEGHSSRRYKVQVGKFYDTNEWSRIHEVSSPAECGNFCTLWDSHNIMCPMFQTEEGIYQKNTLGEDFRGYKCYLLLEDIDTGKVKTKGSGSKKLLWFPNSDTSSARTVNTSSGSLASSCPVVYSEKISLGDMDASTPTIVQGAEAENAIDNDNGTRAETDTATFPWISIDFGKSLRVTRVQILGGEDDNPLENLEVKVGYRNPKSPIDDSYPAMTEQLFGNTRCGVYYGPTRVHNETGQWISVDCGHKEGIVGRFMTIQLLERGSSPSQLVISDIEVEGFHRKCGNPCLSKNVADVDDYIGTIGDGVTDWKLVRYTPASSSWHPARDYLRGTESYGTRNDVNNNWSVKWSRSEADEFLFKVGDHWMIVDREEMVGDTSGQTKYYDQQPVSVMASSEQCDPHKVIMSRVNYDREMPLVHLTDEAEHHAALLYAGDNWARAANPSGPAYVYIRRRAVP